MAVSQQRLDRRAAPTAPEKPAGSLIGVSFVGQAISGAAVLVLITLHMIAQHFLVPNGLRTYEDVISWLANPVVVTLEVLFLVFVTWHALLGARAIIFDWGLSARVERLITRLLILLGIATVAYGCWLTAVLVSRG
jgi:succinate dehydrogenase hydrophobic anchor subunit